MRNKIAWKLTLYFAAVLLIFALVVGGTFMHFFGKHTLDLKKKEMQVRATKIAEVLQDNMSRLQNRYGGGGTGLDLTPLRRYRHQPFHPLYRQYHDGKRVGGR